jgi:hypothetical protein
MRKNSGGQCQFYVIGCHFLIVLSQATTNKNGNAFLAFVSN